MVHGVSDGAITSSPEGPNKADHGDSVTVCTSKKSSVGGGGPFTSRVTANRNRSDTTPNLLSFKHQRGSSSTETKHGKSFFKLRQSDFTRAALGPTREQGRKESNHPTERTPCREFFLFLDSFQNNFLNFNHQQEI